MAEAFVKTFKRDYVSVNPPPDAETVMAQLPFWFEHYNNLHPQDPLHPLMNDTKWDELRVAMEALDRQPLWALQGRQQPLFRR